MYKGRSDGGKLVFEDTRWRGEVPLLSFSRMQGITRGLVPSPYELDDKVMYIKAKNGSRPIGAIGTVFDVNVNRNPGSTCVKWKDEIWLDMVHVSDLKFAE